MCGSLVICVSSSIPGLLLDQYQGKARSRPGIKVGCVCMWVCVCLWVCVYMCVWVSVCVFLDFEFRLRTCELKALQRFLMKKLIYIVQNLAISFHSLCLSINLWAQLQIITTYGWRVGISISNEEFVTDITWWKCSRCVISGVMDVKHGPITRGQTRGGVQV